MFKSCPSFTILEKINNPHTRVRVVVSSRELLGTGELVNKVNKGCSHVIYDGQLLTEQKLSCIKRVDKGLIATVKDLGS